MKKKISFDKISNITSILFVIVVVLFAIYGMRIGLFKDIKTLMELVRSLGYYGPIAFILIQIIQVVVPIIPGGVTLPAGVILFGSFYGFIYNYVSICIGSVINFLLVKKYGEKLVRKIVSEKTYEKYLGWLDKGKKFDILFALAILLPMLPDDFLCRLAGLSNIKFKSFLLIILLLKIPTILAYSLAIDKIIDIFDFIK